MIVKVLVIGKTKAVFLQSGENEYLKRLAHYGRVEWVVLPDIQGGLTSPSTVKEKEGKQFLKHCKNDDHVVLLDEKGTRFNSRGFALRMQKWMNSGAKHVVLIIGGAFGFSTELMDRSNEKISLSDMTFSHEMVRMILLEQLYRAHTIIKGESYHHD